MEVDIKISMVEEKAWEKNDSLTEWDDKGRETKKKRIV